MFNEQQRQLHIHVELQPNNTKVTLFLHFSFVNGFCLQENSFHTSIAALFLKPQSQSIQHTLHINNHEEKKVSIERERWGLCKHAPLEPVLQQETRLLGTGWHVPRHPHWQSLATTSKWHLCISGLEESSLPTCVNHCPPASWFWYPALYLGEFLFICDTLVTCDEMWRSSHSILFFTSVTQNAYSTAGGQAVSSCTESSQLRVLGAGAYLRFHFRFRLNHRRGGFPRWQ